MRTRLRPSPQADLWLARNWSSFEDVHRSAGRCSACCFAEYILLLDSQTGIEPQIDQACPILAATVGTQAYISIIETIFLCAPDLKHVLFVLYLDILSAYFGTSFTASAKSSRFCASLERSQEFLAGLKQWQSMISEGKSS